MINMIKAYLRKYWEQLEKELKMPSDTPITKSVCIRDRTWSYYARTSWNKEVVA